MDYVLRIVRKLRSLPFRIGHTLPVLALAGALHAAPPTNGLLHEVWNNISGTAITNLTSNAAYPNSPSTQGYLTTAFEGPSALADNYGSRVRGYLTPPTTGNYTFWIAGDDNCELWLGTNDQPSTIRRIAYVPEWTNSREWTKFSQQVSSAIALTAGVRYYVETRHKEGTGGDNLAVGWQGPNISGDAERPIPVSRLTPWIIGTAPSITTQPVSATVVSGQTASFSVTATGTAPLAYQWRKNGTNISGATAATYTTPAAASADHGSIFSCVVTNVAGTATSSGATLTVFIPPAIINQQIPPPTLAGTGAIFSVVASGSAPLAYQWRKNGANIPGANTYMYNLYPVEVSDNGSQFDCVVSNSAGTATSTAATLVVTTPPVFSTQPASVTIPVGQTATFTAAATSNLPVTYQWRKNGTNISGATTATYTTPATVAADNGAVFTCAASNSAASTVSNPATLTVTSAPAITAQPANASVTVGQTATFSVTASGSAPLAYQWQKNGTAISGATAATYTTPATVAADNGALFACVVSNTVGSVTSANATLSVQTPPSITGQPANVSVASGLTATFTIVASGSAPLSFQWRKNGTTIPSATLTSYTTAAISSDNGAVFTCVVTNSLGSVTSNGATLTVYSTPVVTQQPVSQTVALGQTATYSVTATGTAPLTYQWRRNGTNISGANLPSYTTPAATASDNGYYYNCYITNPYGTATSYTAYLYVSLPPVINTHPASTTAFVGQSATFSVSAAGTSPLSYQWQKNGTNISGAMSSSYTTPAVTAADSGAAFRCVVTNPYGTATSNAATLTINTVAGYPFQESFETGTLASHWSTYRSNPTYGRIAVTGQNGPYAGSYHAQLDVNQYGYSNISEIILAVDLAGQSNVELSFYHRFTYDYGQTLPSSFTGHYSGAGVSISVDGNTWYKAQGTTSSEGALSTYRLFKVNLDALMAANHLTYTSSFRIKFQQYGYDVSYAHFFDNIRLGTPLPNAPPTVSITSPSNGSSYVTPVNLYVYTNSADTDGSISKVDFYDGTTLLGTSSYSPWTFYWASVPTGTHSLTAVAFDNQSATTTSAAVSVTVREPAPSVYATASPASGPVPFSPAFTASNTGGTVTSWAWTFGDGGTSTVQSPSHTYTAGGSYTATVTATGPGGTSSYNVYVTAIAPPSISITASPGSGTRPLATSFSVNNTGGSISSYSWAFGNGGTSSSSNPAYTYNTAGTFTATLIAANPAGGDTASTTVTVNPIRYSLTPCVTGNGATVPSAPTTVDEQTAVSIAATAADGNQFERWRVQAGQAAIANPLAASTTVTLSGNATVCADFHPNPVTLTILHTGAGTTTPSATAQVIPGRPFDISALPDLGNSFLQWSAVSGDAVIANPALSSTRLTLSQASTVRADFIPANVVVGNRKLSISGELTDASGNPLGYPNPQTIDASIRLFGALTGGAALYTETFLAANHQGITVQDGLFVARLGEGTTTQNLQQIVTGNPQLWVEVTIEGNPSDVLSPRTPLTASSYALGGVPTLAPASAGVMRGTGDPNSIGAGGAIGSYYVNEADNSTWLKISSGWARLQ